MLTEKDKAKLDSFLLNKHLKKRRYDSFSECQRILKLYNCSVKQSVELLSKYFKTKINKNSYSVFLQRKKGL